MPHSVSSDSQQKTSEHPTDPVMAEPATSNGDNQIAADGDVAMADVTDEATTIEESTAVTNSKKDVKLEDLFADVDSDEEFPSTRPSDVPPTSSPPATTPPFPTYVEIYPGSKTYSLADMAGKEM